MTLLGDLPPDPNPGVAVLIYWTIVPRVRALPQRVRAFPDKATNDRICLGPGAIQTYPGNSEFWPMTPESLMLYGLWKDYGDRALCVPLNP